MHRLTLSALLLLILVNIAVLSGVAWNRYGDPLFSMQMTERELSVHDNYRRNEENSGVSLKLEWYVLPATEDFDRWRHYSSAPAWLDQRKMAELGFDIRKPTQEKSNYWNRQEQEVILALEYDGAAYRQMLALMENRIKMLQQDALSRPEDSELAEKIEYGQRQLIDLKQTASRLYVIDADRDRDVLTARYAGQSNILLLKGLIGVRQNGDALSGYIERVGSGDIHVSGVIAQTIEELGDKPEYAIQIKPRFTVTLRVGKRLEPWIESLIPIGTQKG